jgi:ribosomal protein L7/L12
MKEIAVVGWSPGFRKIEFTKLLRRELGLSLSAAKSATDSVLDSIPVTLHIPDSAAPELLGELEARGARIQVAEPALPVSA